MSGASELAAIIDLFVSTPDAKADPRTLTACQLRKTEAIRRLPLLGLPRPQVKDVLFHVLDVDQSEGTPGWRREAWQLLVETYATSGDLIAFARTSLQSPVRATRIEVATVFGANPPLDGALDLLADYIADVATEADEAVEMLHAFTWRDARTWRYVPLALRLARGNKLPLRRAAAELLLDTYQLHPEAVGAVLAPHRDAPHVFTIDLYSALARHNLASPDVLQFWLEALRKRPDLFLGLLPLAAPVLASTAEFAAILRQAIETSPDEKTREVSIDHLGYYAYKDPQTEPTLLSVLKSANTSALRLAALYWLLLRYSDRPAIVEAITEDLLTSQSDFHDKLALCIGGVGDGRRHRVGFDVTDLREREAKTLQRQCVFSFLSRADLRRRLIDEATRQPDDRVATLLRAVVAKHVLEPNMALQRYRTRRVHPHEIPTPVTDDDLAALAKTPRQKMAFALMRQIEALERAIFPPGPRPDPAQVRYVEEHVPVQPETARAWLDVLNDLATKIPPATPVIEPPPRTLDELVAAFEGLGDYDKGRELLVEVIAGHSDARHALSTLHRLLVEQAWLQNRGQQDCDWDDAVGWRAKAWAGAVRLGSCDDHIRLADRIVESVGLSTERAFAKKRSEAFQELQRHYAKEPALLDALMRWNEYDRALWTFGAHPSIRRHLPTLLEKNPGPRAFEVACGHIQANAALRPALEKMLTNCADKLEIKHIRTYLAAVPNDDATETALRTFVMSKIALGARHASDAAHGLQYYLCRFADIPNSKSVALAAAQSPLPRLRRSGLDLLAWFFPHIPETMALLEAELENGLSVEARIHAFYALMLRFSETPKSRMRLRAAAKAEISDEARKTMRRLLDGSHGARIFETDDSLSDRFRQSEDRAFETVVKAYR